MLIDPLRTDVRMMNDDPFEALASEARCHKYGDVDFCRVGIGYAV